MADTVKLGGGTWKLGKQLGSGGFGRVFEASAGDRVGAAKLIPKDPGADRELLFVDLTGIRNVVPIIDHGETDTHWVLVMPQAEKSLRAHLEDEGPLAYEDAVGILLDVADALEDLDGRIVHRDLKPENVLFLEGKWCLADFGISRYAEATTAADTRKFALSPPYAAPERWRNERSTSRTDVYSFGIMAFEVMMARRPFDGPGVSEFREQHLHHDVPQFEGVPLPFAALVGECLYKAQDARPTPAELARRLRRRAAEQESAGLSALEEANRREASKRAEETRLASQRRSTADRREEIAEAAFQGLGLISGALQSAVVDAAPSAVLMDLGAVWRITLGPATLMFQPLGQIEHETWGGDPAFDVIACGEIKLKVPARDDGYSGRSHSLWYCDATVAGDYAWYETAFMLNPLTRKVSTEDPFALAPGPEAGRALSPVIAEYQVAWPFTRLGVDDLAEFIDRWASWLAAAYQGNFNHPHQMPERQPEGSWRR